MKSFYSLFLFCLPFISLSQQTLSDTIQHDGLKRDYILYVPESYEPGNPAPLVFNFHGYTSSAIVQMIYGDFRPIADTAGFLVVHPQGTVDQLGNTHWNVGWGTSTVNDVGFTEALIDTLSVEYSIDQDRIYSTGMSNGGFFSYKLACELSERIAAIASVTGTMTTSQFTACAAEHQMPVMEIHGTADETVPYDGNLFFASVSAVIDYWVDFNATEEDAIFEMIPDTDQSDGSTAEHYRYPDGTNGAEVEHYKIINGGHTWPGSAFGGVGTNQDIDASKEIWRFFSKYDRDGLIGVSAARDVDSQSALLVYPNPARDMIMIECDFGRMVPYQLTNLQGQVVSAGIVEAGSERVSLEAVPKGIYLLSVEETTYRIVVQ